MDALKVFILCILFTATETADILFDFTTDFASEV